MKRNLAANTQELFQCLLTNGRLNALKKAKLRKAITTILLLDPRVESKKEARKIAKELLKKRQKRKKRKKN